MKSPKNESGAKASDYDVGYGKPPAQHRFQKGRSGNPSGARSRKSQGDAFEEQMKSLISEEAYRSVTLRDGNKVQKMPVIRAIIRGVALSAAKGNSKSQRMMTDWLRWIEGDRRSSRIETLNAAIEYKHWWQNELARRERLGLTGLQPWPHPDDIIVDLGSGEVTVKGPITKEEKELREQAIAGRAEVLRRISNLTGQLKKIPDDARLNEELASARQHLFHIAVLEAQPKSKNDRPKIEVP